MSAPLLLDTNVLIWIIIADTRRISSHANRAISDPNNTLFVSVASVWEIVMKHQAGKLALRETLSVILDRILYRSPWAILPITSEHLPVIAALPLIHTDPFDRLLIAQAQYEGLTIVTADDRISEYDVRTLW